MIYRIKWNRLNIFQPVITTQDEKILLSVIIPARNEENNIVDCLESLSKQSLDGNLFEIIIVDDHSTDKTAEVVKNYALPNLTMISLSDFPETEHSIAPKKIAIEKAIEKAKGVWMVTTDADCVFHPNWLSTILSYYETNHPDFIVMPVSVVPRHDWLSKFESIDFMTLQAVTAAGVSGGKLNMCNGANLSYSKKIFEEVGAFDGIKQVASGDDMLLMEKIRMSGGRIHYLFSPEVIVKTKPTENISAFFQQRKRWAGKSAHYRDNKIKTTLLLVYLLNFFFLLGSVILIPFSQILITPTPAISYVGMFSIFLIMKFFAEWIFLIPVADFYKKRNLFLELLVFQPLHIMYIVSTGFLGMFGKYEWKGRQLK